MAYLILESGQAFQGRFRGGDEKAGEVVFNTSHSGYEEMATDPSYFSQIIVTTATQQGNYGVDDSFCESKNYWIHGFICLEIQSSLREASWLNRLVENKVPVLCDVDTRKLTLILREQGTTWGAVVNVEKESEAREKAKELIRKAKDIPTDWTQHVCTKSVETLAGEKKNGPRVAVLDFGTKQNIVRELLERCSEVKVFPSGSSASEILQWNPDGILLSNGPGDPADVVAGTKTVRELLGKKFIFGICMGHQVLSLAMGARTYKLKFGHRGSNHPIKDTLLNRVYVASQNHGYNVDERSLPQGVKVTHTNLNDGTVAGIHHPGMKCMSVQFHPESRPGPHDAVGLFDYFVSQIK